MMQTKNGEVVTTSRRIAKYFGRQHSDVLRETEQVKADYSRESNQHNFTSTDYIGKQGKVCPMYSLTKDDWIMVVVRFARRAAAAIKESCIAAFSWMAEQLNRRIVIDKKVQHHYIIKETRSKLKDTIDSRLMSGRRKEKRILAAEHGYVLQVIQPELLIS